MIFLINNNVDSILIISALINIPPTFQNYPIKLSQYNNQIKVKIIQKILLRIRIKTLKKFHLISYKLNSIQVMCQFKINRHKIHQ